MKPIVSVCVPTYRCAQFLPAAIDSVLAQDFSSFELLVQDNASNDGTEQIMEAYSRQDARISYRVNASNVGMVNNWNLCLERATGKYIKFLCSDDLLSLPHSLAYFVQALEAEPRVSLAASARKVIDANGVPQMVKADYPAAAERYGADVIRDCLLAGRNKIGEISSVMFRREQAHRGFNTEHHHSADLEMFFWLLKQGRFAFIDKPLASFRTYPGQQTAMAKISLEDKEVLATFSMVQRYADDADIGLSRLQRNFVLHDYLAGLRKKNKKGRVSQSALDRVEESFAGEGLLPRIGYKLYRVYRRRLGSRLRRGR